MLRRNSGCAGEEAIMIDVQEELCRKTNGAKFDSCQIEHRDTLGII